MNFFVTFPKHFNLQVDRQTHRQTDEKTNDGSFIYKVFEDILAYFKIFFEDDLYYQTGQTHNAHGSIRPMSIKIHRKRK